MSAKTTYKKHSTFLGIVLKILWILILVFLNILLLRACYACHVRATIGGKTGYLPDKEDWDNIPDVIPPYDDTDTLNLPEAVSLEKYFPPIGDQGDKGTCVAWAVGYNLKTALNAIDGHWDQTQLAQPSNQTSPKDLWLSIPQDQKGNECSGTGFEPALSTLVRAGAASMQDVPYRDLQGCIGSGIGDSNNRIANFYQVNDNGKLPKTGELKAFLADTIPLVIGAQLGDRFMTWRNDKVIKHDTYNYTGMHSYHAMVLVGYDDARHAFRIRNSWGTAWGDNGSIWVDYDFFCQEFCYAVLLAENNKVTNN